MALLILTLALALFSFVSSAFVIIRIILPVLPPNPFSRKVPPSEFGLPTFRSLSPAAKSHLWLAFFDILALAFFVWQALDTPLMSSDVLIHDPLSSARLWIALTTRQTCFLIITALTLIYVRLGRAVYFGPYHSLIWAPTLIFVATGTATATALTDTGVDSLWGGIAGYTTVIGVASSISFGCLVGTLLLIRHNVNAAAQAELEEQNSWPPMEKKILRRSICTEDLEALKDRSSWITSHPSSSSRQNSISAFSFSTTNHATGSASSIIPKSSYLVGTTVLGSGAPSSQDLIPPVPRVPSPYRPHTPPADGLNDADPFHRSPSREAKSSANSWLSSPSVSPETVPDWSFSTTRPVSPSVTEPGARNTVSPTVYDFPIDTPVTPNKSLSQSQVLGGYAPQRNTAALSPKASRDVDISVLRCIGWAVFIWFPLGFSLPYFYLASSSSAFNSPITSILLTLSVTLSSPLLAFNVLFRLPLPIPAALFSRNYTVAQRIEQSNVSETLIHPQSRTRSMSMTVVEGRRSGDVWIARGEAVDGRGKAARALGLLTPTPKLAVLPIKETKNVDELFLPPRPILDESAVSISPSSPSFGSIDPGVARHRRSDSKTSSYYSGIGDHSGHKTQIMVAQRHYSAMATTVYLSSPRNPSGTTETTGEGEIVTQAVSTGVQKGITKGHMRSQSATSTMLHTPRTSMYRFPLTPPPSTPLPPTPPNVKAHHLQHYPSSGASGYSFGPIANHNQIDTLSAGVLPLLVPGLRVSKEMVMKESNNSTKPLLKEPWPRESKIATLPRMPLVTPSKGDEFGFASSIIFHSPVMHSTPARAKEKRKRKHLSLPSLGLGKDGIYCLGAWKDDLVQTLNTMETRTPSARHRRVICSGETYVPPVPILQLREPSGRNISPVDMANVEYGFSITSDDPGMPAQLSPLTSASVYSDGFDTARSSAITVVDQASNSATCLLTSREQQEAAERTAHELSPVSRSRRYHLPIQSPARKTSVAYIKSDENASSSPQPVQALTRTSSLRLSNSLKKQNIPKNSLKNGELSSRSPLRKLTLLANRDLNRSRDQSEDNSEADTATPPLSISKKLTGDASGLRPLQLARSATAKARGFLRQNEVLPEVVVRPPSTNEAEMFNSSQ